MTLQEFNMMDRTLPPIQVIANDRKDFMTKCREKTREIVSLLCRIYTDDSKKLVPLWKYVNDQKAHLANHLEKEHTISMKTLSRDDFQMALTYGAYQMYCKFSANQDHKKVEDPRAQFNDALAKATKHDVANEVYNIINLNRMEDK